MLTRARDARADHTCPCDDKMAKNVVELLLQRRNGSKTCGYNLGILFQNLGILFQSA